MGWRVPGSGVVFSALMAGAALRCGTSDSPHESLAQSHANKGGAVGEESRAGGTGASGEQASGGTGSRVSAGGAAELPDALKTYPATLQGLFSAQCDAAGVCCLKQGLEAPPQNCRHEFRQGELETLLSSDHVRLDLGVLERCILAYENVQTTCTDTGVAAACRGLVLGSLSEGEACSRFEQCDRRHGPVDCRYAANETQGRCFAVVHGTDGRACDRDCPSGVECSGTVQVLGDVHEPWVYCFEDEGLYCSGAESPPACRRIRAIGEECESGQSCGASKARCRSLCEPRPGLDTPCETIQRDACAIELQCSGEGAVGQCAEYEFVKGGMCE